MSNKAQNIKIFEEHNMWARKEIKRERERNFRDVVIWVKTIYDVKCKKKYQRAYGSTQEWMDFFYWRAGGGGGE